MSTRQFSFAKWLVAVALFGTLGALNARAQVTAAPRITQAITDSNLVTLRGNVYPLARPEYDRGLAPASLAMDRMMLVLKRSPQQVATLDALLAQQQDRNSPNYHKWLTPTQFGAEFGPSDQNIETIEAWLESQGFGIDSVSKGRTVIEFSGSAGEVQSAFHTAIHRYVLPSGAQHWANSTDPEIPAALAPVIAGIRSLNDFYPQPQIRVRASKPSPRPLFSFPSGCSTSATSTDECYFGLGPADFDKIYNVPSSLTGAGETIAIVSDSDIQPTDIDQFRAAFGLPAKNFTQIETDTAPGGDPGIGGPNSDEVEAILDAEWAGAVAPAAQIDLVVSPSTDTTFGGDTSALYIINDMTPTPPILSYSYGECELGLGTTANQFYLTNWQQAQAEGITVLVSSGDNGSAGCDTYEANGPPSQPAQYGLEVNGVASTPYNVAVGGTDFNDINNPGTYWSAANNANTQLSALGYIPETTWNDTCTNSFFYSTVFGDSTALAGCNDLANQTNLYDDYDIVVTNPVGGSGGVSNCTTSNGSTPSSCSGGYAKPTWQTGPGVPNDGKRDLPDLSLFGSDGLISGSFYIDCEEDATDAPCNLASGDFQGIGGTSVSTQVMAGIVALIDQKTGSSQGNINPTLYSLAAQQSAASCNTSSPASSCVFHDVTSGTIEMPCEAGSIASCSGTGAEDIGVTSGYNAGTGYDLATGLGSLNVANLANLWGPAFYISSTSPATSVSSPGQSNTLDITVYAVNGFTGSVMLACTGLPSGASCTFAPSSVSLTSTNKSVSATVTVSTTAASAIYPEISPEGIRKFMSSDAIAAGLVCFIGLALICWYRIERRWIKGAVAIVAFSILIVAAGCGGGGSSPSANNGGGGGGGAGGTPTGTATVTITGANGTVTCAMNFQLTVN
ncbi:MAG: S53 family peptidase [Candidatus Acidiferrales bacterium]